MDDKRPVNLDLLSIKIPIAAAVSFAHRVSGVAIFPLIFFLLWLLDMSLSSEEGFNEVKHLITQSIWIKVFLFVTLSAIGYHLIAGVRHLLMDFGLFENLESGKKAPWVSLYYMYCQRCLLPIGYSFDWCDALILTALK